MKLTVTEPEPPISCRALRDLSTTPPFTDWEIEAQSREWLVPEQSLGCGLVPSVSSELSNPQSIHAQF